MKIHPVPKPRNDFSSLDSLKVGESVTFPRRVYDSISVCTASRSRRLGFKFARKMEGEVVRVWRTQ
jgi:hypothetical protein